MMKRIYSHSNLGVVHMLKNDLEQHGIETAIPGELGAALFTGGAAFEAWLWIADEARLDEAAGLIQRVIEEPAPQEGPSWRCPSCTEEVDASLAMCWHCGEAPPEQAA
jgi:hypothetical protein